MESKTFEVRDAGTFIPCLAIRLNPVTDADFYLISRAGYGATVGDQKRYVLFGRLQAESEFQYDPFAWGNRTMQTAHRYVVANFDKVESGEVVDVQFILSETSEPKLSEMQEYQSSPHEAKVFVDVEYDDNCSVCGESMGKDAVCVREHRAHAKCVQALKNRENA